METTTPGDEMDAGASLLCFSPPAAISIAPIEVVVNSESPHKSSSGFVRIWRALFYSLAGLRSAWRDEQAFRQEIALAAVLIPGAAFVPGTITQKALLIGSVLIVLVVELLNSAVETTVDRISLDDHDLAKRAKDVSSAAVLLALANLALVWGMVLFDVFG